VNSITAHGLFMNHLYGSALPVYCLFEGYVQFPSCWPEKTLAGSLNGIGFLYCVIYKGAEAWGTIFATSGLTDASCMGISFKRL